MSLRLLRERNDDRGFALWQEYVEQRYCRRYGVSQRITRGRTHCAPVLMLRRARGGDGRGHTRSVRQERRDAGGIAAAWVREDARVQGAVGAAPSGRVSFQRVFHRKWNL